SPAANNSAKAEVPAATKAAETAAGQSTAVLQGSAQSTAVATPQGSTPSTIGTPVPTTSPVVVTTEKPTSQETAAADKAAAPEKSDILQIKDFLNETGPANGVSFALLIIWSFIAGFAERLVPDTLNRLVAKNEAQGN
ncbi:MAG: hypothetical protein M3R69_05745, partial [Acidobacteriota bacterium]|nr:hypothetical protein [Acidobacteriota bacterium]